MKTFKASVLVALLLSVAAIGPVFAKGKIVGYVEPKNAVNPAPVMALNTFQRFEITPIAMDAPYAGQPANEDAKGGIQRNLDQDVQPMLAEWNAKPVEGAARTLKIEPTIRHIKFVGTAARIWVGGWAGGSAVLMTVKLSDAQTGELIAEPEFYQHADKRGGTWTFGATDRAMLVRIATMISDYLQKNYSTAVGGSTSVAPDAKS